MKAVFACAALLALAACNSEEPAEAQAAEAPVAAAPLKPTMPAPDEELFAAAYAEACGDAQPVGASMCKSQGMGKEGFVCEYALGDDEHLRNETTIKPVEGKWALAEPEKTCAADAA